MSFRLSWMLQSSFKSMTDVTGAGMTVGDEDDAEVGGGGTVMTHNAESQLTSE